MKDDVLAVLIGIIVFIWVISSWFTHIFVCLSNESWGFLIAGALAFPVAVIHGTGIWFGIF